MTEETNQWNAADYDGSHDFVYEYGADVLGLLDPQPGERVLDLGCGTGRLTAQISDAVGPDGSIVGIDKSPEMLAQARESSPDIEFVRADAREFAVSEPFDAVFSNAALHWIDDQHAVTEAVRDVLRPGGRFVAELGGSGNVEHIVDAVKNACAERGYAVESPWYFPTVGEHATLLESHGFAVTFARLFDRQTELDDGADGLQNWLSMFGDSLFAALSATEREAVIDAVEERLRPQLFDTETETWTADYRRLRFVAHRTAAE
jgi:trans-aconitate methyltransferase